MTEVGANTREVGTVAESVTVPLAVDGPSVAVSVSTTPAETFEVVTAKVFEATPAGIVTVAG